MPLAGWSPAGESATLAQKLLAGFSFHAEANPYLRYKWHPGEITLCLKAGTALIIPINMFHGTHPNRTRSQRTLVQLGYRPAWAGPIKPMDEWGPVLVAAAPPETQRFLQVTKAWWIPAHSIWA